MSTNKQTFENLLKIGQIKAEPFIQAEFDGLTRAAQRKLKDASNLTLSIDSRFDLAYNAAHALALAALRKTGHRSENRYLVFQLLELTAGLPPASWRIFAMAHQKRNMAEYEGITEIESSLLEALLNSTEQLSRAICQSSSLKHPT
ncbi:hypothetical protein [Limnobacter sp.]|uniref:hypothetical protein n=1 Tax=Limnobacter sp. TaxID=2003368 RepID=UPI003519C15D